VASNRSWIYFVVSLPDLALRLCQVWLMQGGNSCQTGGDTTWIDQFITEELWSTAERLIVGCNTTMLRHVRLRDLLKSPNSRSAAGDFICRQLF